MIHNLGMSLRYFLISEINSKLHGLETLNFTSPIIRETVLHEKFACKFSCCILHRKILFLASNSKLMIELVDS